MRKTICLVLALLLLSTCGCKNKEDVHFFYPRTEIRYDVADGVITSEPRDIGADDIDLTYTLKLYLEGPISQDLRSPFPRGTSLESLSYAGGQLFLVLSEPFAALENLDYMIASACLASTCFDLTDAETVTIKTKYTSITLTRENLVLEDMVAASSPK